MYIYGIHPTEELIETVPEQIDIIYCEDIASSKLDRVRELVGSRGLGLKQVSRADLDRMAEGGNHQGIVIETCPFQYVGLSELLDATADKQCACLVVLDQIQDPQNLGAILRSAAAMGVDGAIIPKDRAVGVTAAVVRASAGQALRVPVARITNVARTLDSLKEHGWWAAGGAADASATPLWEMDFAMKTALVMGGEHQGIRRLVGEKCDFTVRIPMAPGVESFNVAAAASIMLYEVRRQWAHIPAIS